MTHFKKIKIVVAGAGFGGMYTVRQLLKLMGDCCDIEITVINERNYFLFTPLLHEVATGNISPENIIEPIRELLRGRSGDLYLGRVESVSLANKEVVTNQGVVPYDYLIIALGSESNFFGVPGVAENAFTLKTIEDALKIKNQIIENIERALRVGDEAERRQLLHFVIIGAGATGVELAGEFADFIQGTFRRYYPSWLLAETKISLVHRGAEILEQFSPLVRARAFKTLTAKKIDILLEEEVTAVSSSSVSLKSGRELAADIVIWSAGVKPPDLGFDTEVEKARDGRLVVDEYLRLKGHSNVFVLGDLAYALDWRHHKPLPALAQVATKQGKAVARNMYRMLTHHELEPFHYHHTGSLVSVGEWRAAGDIGPVHLWGRATWWLWRAVYWSKLLSTSKQLQVALDWLIDLWLPRDISDYYEGKSKK